MSDEYDPELKPCPFCGGEAEFVSGSYNDVNFAYVRCTDCSAQTCYDSDHDDMTFEEMEAAAVSDWNRRV